MRIRSALVRLSAATTVAALTLGGLSAASASAAPSAPTVDWCESNDTSVSFHGENLGAPTKILFESTPAASFLVVSNEEVVATPPANLDLGYYDVTIATAAGMAADSCTYTKRPTEPVITTVTPSTLSTAGNQTVTVVGQNLQWIKAVAIDGVPVDYDLLSDSKVQLTTKAHDAGNAELSLSTLGGTDTATVTFSDTVGSASALSLSSVTPATGYIYGYTKVIVKGTGLDDVNKVTFGGVPAASFTKVSDTELKVVSPAATTAGAVALMLSTPAASVSTNFTYTYMRPSLNWLSPSSGPKKGGTTVVLNGWGFLGTTSVKVGGTPVPFTVIDDKHVSVKTPAHNAGPVSVSITNPTGSAARNYTYR